MEKSRRTGRLLDVFAVVLLWALLFVPNYGVTEFVHEEPRRVQPAAEMLESHEWVVPTIWGRPYLSKPPLHYWTIAGAARLGGELTPAVARWPSLASTLGLALLVYLLGNRVGRKVGLAAAALFLTAPLTLEKGALAEHEAAFAFWVSLSIVLGWKAVGRSSWWAVAAGLLLGLAVLHKGPAAWVFFGGGILGPISFDRTHWRRRVATFGTAFVVSGILPGVWALELLSRVDPEHVQERWSHEIAHGNGWPQYFSDRWRFIAGVLGGFFWVALLAAVVGIRSIGRRRDYPDVLRVGMAVFLVAALFFLVYPRAKPRYLFPALPWLALVAGDVLVRAIENRQRWSTAVLRGAVGSVCILGALAAVLVLADWSFGVVDKLAINRLGLGLGLLLAGATVGTSALLFRGARAPAVLAALAVFVLVRMIHLTQIVPARADQDRYEAHGGEVAAVLPTEARVFCSHWGDFHTLIYVGRAIRFTDRPLDEVAVGDVLLIEAGQAQEEGLLVAPVADPEWERLAEVPLRKGALLHVLRRRG